MKRQIPHPRRLAWLTALACTALAAEPALTLNPVEVMGATPLPGLGLPRDAIPAPVQRLGAEALAARPGGSLADLLQQQLGGVFLNDIQGNPWQADLSYRGFTASPLLGTPQGLSLYMDGVRLNQPFGDVVSWDLIPRSAIAGIDLMPGSNPVYGLNTLGGALAVHTKSGLSHAGSAVELGLGSYGRQMLTLEHGGRNAQGLHWFVTGNTTHDGGWRDDSPSRLGQLFGKLGWQGGATDLALTVALARTMLTGNGLQDVRQLDRDWRSVYSKPDETRNRSLFLNLEGKHSVNADTLLAGNLYYRRVRTTTYNGDINEDSLDQSVYQPSAAERTALAAAGYRGFPTSGASAANTPFPYWRCLANVLLADEPAEKCNGLINRSQTTQENYGWSGQLTRLGEIAGQRNQWTLGAGYDSSRMHFTQSAQFGYLNPDRSIVPVAAYADGSYTGDDGQPIDSRVDLRGRTQTWSVYATDTLSLFERLHLTVSGRFNSTTVRNRDQITPGGQRGSLDGDHRFSRFNPALGLAYAALPTLTLYAGYNEGSRTPTAVELGCADPANPCKLPNAMAGDPPLKQVVTRTWEAGLRGGNSQYRWHAGVFRADNRDDILFVAGQANGFGYFRNFGETRRQGAELGASAQLGSVRLSADYTYLDATFESAETVNGAANSSQDANGNIAIRPGNRMPLSPRNQLRLRAEWQASGQLALSLGMLAVSDSLARGNENGLHQADGVRYLGSGRVPGHALFDLGAKYRPSPALTVFASVYNLFDRRYASAAQLGATALTANGSFIARPFAASGDNTTLLHSSFQAPGAPRTAWIGFRYAF
ncbi:TonB-dependent receptor [Dechloromonas sp. ZY10]|uniref:TonB-dependent receptor n=1 Tax=Dechloromonas aquae TaxID=2664436 RepID=UPI003528143D